MGQVDWLWHPNFAASMNKDILNQMSDIILQNLIHYLI